MPVILRQKGFAFFFVMFDLSEPVHVHVRKGRNEAKFWIDPFALAWGRTALNRDEIATASFSSADALYVEPNH